MTGFFRVQWLAHKSERLPIREEIPGAPDAALRACQPFPAPLGPEFSSFLYLHHQDKLFSTALACSPSVAANRR